MIAQPNAPTPVLTRRFPLLAVVALMVVVFAASIYANLSFAVTNKRDFEYFPPFKPYHDGNMNRHLGAEYYSIASSIVAGDGFSSPFQERKTGPTAWMPPLLTYLLAGLIWATGNDKDAVMAVMIFFQVYTIVMTGIIVLVLVWQTSHRRLAVWFATLVFLGALAYEFHACFQMTHDSWFVLFAVDLLVAAFCWFRPLGRLSVTVGWGILGGFCALVNPIVALVWGVLSLIVAVQQRAWTRFGVAALVSLVVIAPWTVRNFLVFGRLIPVKSNLAYELYQSQCLQPDGLIQQKTFDSHPYGNAGRERQEYKRLGEMAFLDRKRELFWQSVRADPLEFIDRVACRLLGTTLWYVPFNRTDPTLRPKSFWASRLIHPLPFLALLVLAGSSIWVPLHRSQWAVMAVYLLYLSPYIAASWYDRYGLALLGVKVLLVIWVVVRLLSFIPWRKPSLTRQEHPSPVARPTKQKQPVPVSG